MLRCASEGEPIDATVDQHNFRPYAFGEDRDREPDRAGAGDQNRSPAPMARATAWAPDARNLTMAA
jgi:hypothetical protein